ncbi:MAG: hypothetical protein GY868_20200, partial [Deltaproteobacteria bacterium]|nr:hypothetical protein [Deltaproteobacteria bacterium]
MCCNATESAWAIEAQIDSFVRAASGTDIIEINDVGSQADEQTPAVDVSSIPDEQTPAMDVGSMPDEQTPAAGTDSDFQEGAADGGEPGDAESMPDAETPSSSTDNDTPVPDAPAAENDGLDVAVLSPDDAAGFAHQTMVLFAGSATDSAGRSVPDGLFVWTSSSDG